MFNESTVFILGAGASCHYGYPSGETLIQKVKETAGELSAHYGRMFDRDGERDEWYHPKFILGSSSNVKGLVGFIEKLDEIKKRLEHANPLVIDYFLARNPGLQDIGKFLISWVLLECECEQKRNFKNFLKKDDWLKFILHMLQSECQSSESILLNKVTFITFNYDVSLEHRLFLGLKANEFFLESHRNTFFENLIFHVYGKVRNYGFEDQKFGDFSSWSQIQNTAGLCEKILKENADKAWDAAQGIATIPELKQKNSEVIREAKEKIVNAKNVYIFGYGFDPNNNTILELKQSLNVNCKDPKRIHFTNWKDSNRINKRAGKLFLDTSSAFLGCLIPGNLDPHEAPIVAHNRRKNGWYHEKSIEKVYEALAQDFDIESDS
jgi:hypothetical protein